ncbi:unnamed protein product [Microthlaspi erraticum]|uniref:Uncharacterized protein n=1 Tax=Microthlaspi erraticum TaxID=1685480 RepID=A0A6D2HXU9_9BRAS|nr:unnamed protein product [Microthlaspi erraticum]
MDGLLEPSKNRISSIMECLSEHLIHKVLFRLDPRSLVMMRCTNKSLQSHTQEPHFESEYFSRVKSGLLHISSYGFEKLCYQPYVHSKSRLGIKDTLECQILGSCSGLLLLLFRGDDLCVANPLTKKFRVLDLSRLMVKNFCRETKKHIGFAVDQIDQATQSFKIVNLGEENIANETRYEFEIYAEGDSWRDSKTKITCRPSDLDSRMKNPVYLDGSLHWLREDGGIVAFNPKTQEARLVPTKLPQELSLKTLFTAGDSRLTLVSATKEVIYVYALQGNYLRDPKWVLVTRIRNIVLDEKRLGYWNVEAYDGKFLVLREDRGTRGDYYRVLHVYDLSTNKWEVVGSIPIWCDAERDVFQFTPSWSSVVGLDETLDCGDKRDLPRKQEVKRNLSLIMGLIDVESPFRKRAKLT